MTDRTLLLVDEQQARAIIAEHAGLANPHNTRASDVPVTDAGNHFAALEVEGALQEEAQARKAHGALGAAGAHGGLLAASEKGAAGGLATLDVSGKVPLGQLLAAVANGLATLDGTAKVPMAQLLAGVAGGLATLGADGKLPTSQLGALAITDTHVVASEAAMLGLAAERGDVAVRTDLNRSFVLRAEPASTLANWQELLTPIDAILSVNGKTGTVSLTAADVGAMAAALKGVAGGVAELDASGRVPLAQIGGLTDAQIAASAAIVKSKLAALALVDADLAAGRHLPLTVANAAERPATARVGKLLYQQDTKDVLKNTGTEAAPAWELVGGGAGAAGYVATTHIEGLNVEWVSGSELRVTPGSAYVPGPARVVEVAAAISKAALAFAANAWHYVYLFVNAQGAPDVEVLAVAPAAPYRGFARVKGGATPDSTRRYLGAVRSSGAATPLMWMFHRSDSGLVLWKENLDQAPFLLLNNAATGTTTAVASAAAIVPPTARAAYMRVFLSTASRAMIGSPDDQSGTGTVHDIRPNQYIPIFAALDASQQFYHRASAAGSIFAAALGYVEEGR